jgi:hypothetical protein
LISVLKENDMNDTNDIKRKRDDAVGEAANTIVRRNTEEVQGAPTFPCRDSFLELIRAGRQPAAS